MIAVKTPMMTSTYVSLSFLAATGNKIYIQVFSIQHNHLLNHILK